MIRTIILQEKNLNAFFFVIISFLLIMAIIFKQMNALRYFQSPLIWHNTDKFKQGNMRKGYWRGKK